MTSGSSDTHHLIAQVRSVAAGGPYVVAERPYGFDLTVDARDAEAASLIGGQAHERVPTHRVRLDETAHAVSITGTAHDVDRDEGHQLVREAAEALGWHERSGRDRRIALAFAGIGVAGLLVAGLIALVITLAG